MKLLKSIVGYVKKRVTILPTREEEAEQKPISTQSQKKFLVGGNDTVKSSTKEEKSYPALRFGLLGMAASFLTGFVFAWISLVLWLLGR